MCVALTHSAALKMILDASSRGLAESVAKRRVAEEQTNGCSQRRNIARLDENAVAPVVDNFENAIHGCSDDRFAAGHRFDNGDAEAFESRRKHKQSAIIQKLCHGRSRLLPDQ